MREPHESAPQHPPTTRRGPGRRGPLLAVLVMLVPLFLWALNPSKPSIGDDAGTDPLGGYRNFTLYAPIIQDYKSAALISQDQTNTATPFSYTDSGTVGAPLTAFDAHADSTYSHAIAWGRDGKGDFVLEARVFHQGGSSSSHSGAVSLAATYVGSSSPVYVLQSFDIPAPPESTSNGKIEKSRCVDMAALDIDGDGIRDFVVVYGSMSSTGKLRAVAINGNLEGNKGLVHRFVTDWISRDGSVHLVPHARIAAGNFLGDGTPAVAFLAAEQNDTKQPTETTGTYVLWTCSFGRDFFANGTKTLSAPQSLPQGFDSHLTGECDLAAGDIDGNGADEILPLIVGRYTIDKDKHNNQYPCGVADLYAYRSSSSGSLSQIGSAGGTRRVLGECGSASHYYPLWTPVRCGAGDMDGDGKDELAWVGTEADYDTGYSSYGSFFRLHMVKYDGSLSYKYDAEYYAGASKGPMDNHDNLHFDLAVGHLSSAYALPNSDNGNLIKEQAILSWRGTDDDSHIYARGLTWSGSAFEEAKGSSSFKLGELKGGKGLMLVLGDWNDRSLTLGDPVHYRVYGSISPIVVIQEPPKHFDLVDGTSIDAFRTMTNFQGQFNLSSTSSDTATTTNVTDWSVGVQSKGSLTFGVLRSYNLSSALHAAVKGKKSDLDKQVADQTSASTAAAENDDQIYFTIQNLDVWRYPISGETATDGEGNVGPAWFQVVVPVSSDAPTNASINGVNLEWYQPIHENGNLFSYPNSISRIADYPGGTGNLTDNYTFSTSYNSISYAMTWKNSQFISAGNTLGGNLGASLTFGVGSRKKEGDPNGWNASIGVTGDGAYSHAVTTQSDFSNCTSLKLQKPDSSNYIPTGPITWNHLIYGVTAQVFQAGKGYMTVGFSPNLLAAGGGDYWNGSYKAYGTPYYDKPDPALNLPRKFVSIPFRDDNGYDRHHWLLSDAVVSHDIRGIYFTTESGDVGSVLPDSSTNNVGVDLPKGEKIYVNCRVYNYSFLPVSNVKVRFYYAPYNPQPGQQTEGTPVEIGTVDIDRIPGWTSAGSADWAWAKVLWDTSNIPLPSSTDNYMVRVRIDPDGTIDEVHDDGDPADNNTGRYEVALVGSEDLGLSSSLLSGNRTSILISSCDLTVSADSLSVSKNRVEPGEPILVNAAVLLSGTDRQRPRVFVGFFDGKPGEGGRLFDIHRIPLLTPDVPYSVQAAFRSSIPGEHVLYAMILGEPGNRKSGETVSVPVTVSDTGSSGSGGCNAAGPGSAAALGFLIPLSLLGRRRR